MQFDPKIPNLAAEYHLCYQQNIGVFMQNDHQFKKYQLLRKFIFQQLVAKIANFVYIRQNKSIFTK